MKHDVAVLGGGLAGLTLALTIAKSGLRVVCIDHADPAGAEATTADGRTMAISYGSRKVVEAAGIWELLAPHACPIRDIQITEGGGPVLLQFSSAEAGGRTFGWITEIGIIRRSLVEAARRCDNLTYLAPRRVMEVGHDDQTGVTLTLDKGKPVKAALLVGADGRKSFVRDWMNTSVIERAYGQRAIVCTAVHENPHGNIAVEDFRPEGPFAILPMKDDEHGRHRSSIVWTEHSKKRCSALDYSMQTFDAALAARFPGRYGKVTCLGKRFSYPLSLAMAKSYTGPRAVLIGDAAHGIHPIAGQGLNIGLRDVACLSGLLCEAHEKSQDPGSVALLRRYERERRFDNSAMAAGTDILNSLFANDFLPVSLVRRAGLRLVARLPRTKRFLMRQAMGDSAAVRKWQR